MDQRYIVKYTAWRGTFSKDMITIIPGYGAGHVKEKLKHVIEEYNKNKNIKKIDHMEVKEISPVGWIGVEL